MVIVYENETNLTQELPECRHAHSITSAPHRKLEHCAEKFSHELKL